MVSVQFVMSCAFTSLGPVLPLFLPQIGVRSPEAVDLWAGVLNSANFLVAAFVSPLWGRLGDRHGRKLMVMRSSAAIFVFSALMSLVTSVWQLLALRLLQGAFSGFSATAIALVAGTVPGRRMGYALGWLSTGQLVGTLAGPLVGGALADVTQSYRLSFALTSTLAAVAFLLCWFLVPATHRGVPSRRDAGTWAAIGALRRAPGLLPLMLVLLLAQFGVRTVQPVITLFVQELTGPVANLATFAGAAFSVTAVADLIGSPLLGRRSDVLGYRRVLSICLLGAALATVPQAFAGSYWSFVSERFALGLFVGGILPTANALIGQLVPASERGLVYGVTASATFLGSFSGPLAGGAIAAAFGIRAVFGVTASVLVATLLWVRRSVPAELPPLPAK